jgi:formate--tetrahydrofolate ligase
VLAEGSVGEEVVRAGGPDVLRGNRCVALGRLPRGREKLDAVGSVDARRDGVEELGLGRLPICMAKTHLSLSHDLKLRNAPRGFTVSVRDIRAYTGAGWLVALCGEMQTMPGLDKHPAAFEVDLGPDGRTVGLF